MHDEGHEARAHFLVSIEEDEATSLRVIKLKFSLSLPVRPKL